MQADKPLVSVLMTSYNREQYIAESIESVLASTYPNFEVIILDNCSTDNTFEIAQKYAALDSRIRAYRNETNIGQFPNRNKIVEYANGEYIKYVDSDDQIYPHTLDVMIRNMSKDPQAAIGISLPDAELRLPYPVVLTPHQAFARNYLVRGTFYSGPTATIMKKECFVEVGGFLNRNLFDDIELLIKLASRWPVVIMQPALSWWRIHDGQLANDFKTIGKYDLMAYQLNLEALTSEYCPLNDEERELAIVKLKRRTILNVVRMTLKYKMPRKAFKIASGADLTISDFFRSVVKDKKLKLDIPI